MFAIKTKGGYLNGFYPNGLPVGKKCEYVEKFNKLFPVLKLSDVILQSGGKIIFDTEKEANEYIGYIKKSIMEETERYENARTESTNALLSLVDSFTIRRV